MISSQAHVIKTLIETISNNFKEDLCLEFDEAGVKCEQVTTSCTRMVNFVLPSDSMLTYEVDCPFIIGIHLAHLLNALKTVRKTDTLEMRVEEGGGFLDIRITAHDHSRHISHAIPIFTDIHQIKIEPLPAHTHSMAVTFGDFAKLIKDVSSRCGSVTVLYYATSASLKLICQAPNSAQRTLVLGRDPVGEPAFSGEFACDFIAPLYKIVLVTQQLRLNFGDDLPIRVSCRVHEGGMFNYFVNPSK